MEGRTDRQTIQNQKIIIKIINKTGPIIIRIYLRFFPLSLSFPRVSFSIPSEIKTAQNKLVFLQAEIILPCVAEKLWIITCIWDDI